MKPIAKVIAATKAMGLHFLSDPDARPDGSAHAEAHLWDNGTDAVAELHHIMEVRKSALAWFGENSIAVGTPFSELESIGACVSHAALSVEAAAKWIGVTAMNTA